MHNFIANSLIHSSRYNKGDVKFPCPPTETASAPGFPCKRAQVSITSLNGHTVERRKRIRKSEKNDFWKRGKKDTGGGGVHEGFKITIQHM